VKTSLLISGTTDDAVLTRLLDAADSFIAEYTGRSFAGGTFTETHHAGRELVFLRNFPVATLTSLKVDAAREFGPYTTRAIDTFVVHSDRGVIESVTGPFLKPRRRDDWPGALQVEYTTATGAVPGAVKEAFCQLIGHWYRMAKTAAGQNYEMLTRRLESSVEKEWPWSVAAGEPLPLGVRELLQPYRVPAA
jgi:uncharacterized phiE125 gp8 family phage protein